MCKKLAKTCISNIFGPNSKMCIFKVCAAWGRVAQGPTVAWTGLWSLKYSVCPGGQAVGIQIYKDRIGWGLFVHGHQILGDHLSMGTELVGTICPGGSILWRQEVRDLKSGNQMRCSPWSVCAWTPQFLPRPAKKELNCIQKLKLRSYCPHICIYTVFLAWHIVNIFSIHDSPSISGLIVFTNTSYANWEKDLKNFTTSHFISKKRNCHETENISNSPSANKVKKNPL